MYGRQRPWGSRRGSTRRLLLPAGFPCAFRSMSCWGWKASGIGKCSSMMSRGQPARTKGCRRSARMPQLAHRCHFVRACKDAVTLQRIVAVLNAAVAADHLAEQTGCTGDQGGTAARRHRRPGFTSQDTLFLQDTRFLQQHSGGQRFHSICMRKASAPTSLPIAWLPHPLRSVSALLRVQKSMTRYRA